MIAAGYCYCARCVENRIVSYSLEDATQEILRLRVENEALKAKIRTILDITLPPERTEDNDRTN